MMARGAIAFLPSNGASSVPFGLGGFWSTKVKAILLALLSLHASGQCWVLLCHPSKKACEVSRMARDEKRHSLVKSFLTFCVTER